MDLLDVVIVITLGSLGAAIAKDAWWDSEDVPFLANGIHAGLGYEGTDEYQPLGSDRYDLPGTDANGELIAQSPAPPFRQFAGASTDAAPSAALTFQIQRWIANQRVFTVEASAPTTLALHLLNYPGWQVQVDGNTIRAQSAPKTGEMLVALPAGTHVVNMRFRNTWDRIAGALISLAFAFALLAFALMRRSPR